MEIQKWPICTIFGDVSRAELFIIEKPNLREKKKKGKWSSPTCVTVIK